MATKLPTSPVSNWTVHGLLARLPEFRRVDRGTELLAFRLAGDAPGRTVYVQLYGEDPTAIHFDLEDLNATFPEWDRTPEQGSVTSIGDLALVLRWWLADRAAVA